MNRPKLILALLLSTLVVFVVIAWFRMPRQKTVEQLTFQQGSTVLPNRGKKMAGTVGLRLDLQEQKPVVVAVKKNIFRPLMWADAKPRATAATGKQTRVQPDTPPPPPPPTPQEIAQKQLAAFTVIGSYTKKNNRILFLARGEEILTVRSGDTLIPGYAVSAIHDNQMELRSNDGTHKLVMVIPLA